MVIFDMYEGIYVIIDEDTEEVLYVTLDTMEYKRRLVVFHEVDRLNALGYVIPFGRLEDLKKGGVMVGREVSVTPTSGIFQAEKV